MQDKRGIEARTLNALSIAKNYDTINGMFVDFIRRSGAEYSVQDIFDFINRNINNPSVLVVGVFDGDVLKGYGIAVVGYEYHGEKELFIWQAYSTDRAASKCGLEYLEGLARLVGCKSIKFSTQRNPEVYQRALKGYKLESYILRRTL